MPQLRNPLTEIRIPYTKMTFTPDVPSTALGASEYNVGLNIESDVRGVRSVFGELEIFASLTGTPVYITGGYRQDGNFYYIVACVEDTNEGRWYQVNDLAITNITPGFALDPTANLPGYTTNINITEAWNGTTLIINDGINPPFFLQGNATEFQLYSLTQDLTVYNVVPYSYTTLYLETNEYLPSINVPYVAGDNITIEGVVYPDTINGSYTIQSVLGNYALEIDTPADLYAADFVADISGYTMTVSTVNYGTINVGDYVCAPGILYGTYVYADLGGGVYDLDQSQTIASTAMATIPAYTQGGVIRPEYQWNYDPNWTALSAQFLRVFSTPNVGSILIAGNLTATDVNSVTSQFPNTVRWSQEFGLDQVPSTWAPTVTNIANELEVPLRGPVLDGFPCNGNFFVCSYWDTVVFSPINYQTTQVPILGVRLFNQGRGLLNSNCWVNADDTVYGLDARDFWVFNGQDFKPLGNQRIRNYLFDNINPLYTNQVFLEFNSFKNQVEIYYPDLTSTGFCNRMIAYRYDLDQFQPPREVPDVIMAHEGPIYRGSPYNQFDSASRCVSFVRAVENSSICQKDQGYSFVGATPIASLFQRDSIRLTEDYSQEVMVHRILPEVNSIDLAGLAETPSTGSVTITVGGSGSAGAGITYQTPVVLDMDTEDPWTQINQNVYRSISVKLEHTSSTTGFIASAITWQYMPVEDSR